MRRARKSKCEINETYPPKSFSDTAAKMNLFRTPNKMSHNHSLPLTARINCAYNWGLCQLIIRWVEGYILNRPMDLNLFCCETRRPTVKLFGNNSLQNTLIKNFIFVHMLCTVKLPWTFNKAKFQCRTAFNRYTISTLMQQLAVNALGYKLNMKSRSWESVPRRRKSTPVSTFEVNTLTRNVSFSYTFSPQAFPSRSNTLWSLKTLFCSYYTAIL